MNSEIHNFSVPPLTISLSDSPRTAGDLSREFGKSVTAIKTLALQVNAPFCKTGSGIWIFEKQAVEKLRAEIQRRELEALRR